MASAEKKRLRLCSLQDFKCMSIHLRPQQQKALDITHSGLTDLQATSSAASSLRRSSFPSEYRYSMAMFFPSTYPSSRSPCLNASMRVTLAEGRHRLDIRSAGPSSAAAPRRTSKRQRAGRQQLRKKLSYASFYPFHSTLLTRPPSHLMTLSALASTFGGIVRPICLANLRLMVSSNFNGCSTGSFHVRDAAVQFA